jgi:hypothetical protein
MQQRQQRGATFSGNSRFGGGGEPAPAVSIPAPVSIPAFQRNAGATSSVGGGSSRFGGVPAAVSAPMSVASPHSGGGGGAGGGERMLQNKKLPENACVLCEKPVYRMEAVKYSNLLFHRWCLRCTECKISLSQNSVFIAGDGNPYCKTHNPR